MLTTGKEAFLVGLERRGQWLKFLGGLAFGGLAGSSVGIRYRRRSPAETRSERHERKGLTQVRPS